MKSITLTKFFLVICLLMLSSCLRYFPASKHVSKKDISDSKVANIVGGKEEFFSVDREQDVLLQNLLNSRKDLLTSSELSSYKIGVGDLLDIKVFDVPELNTSVRVRPDGFISLPLVGNISALNKTEAEVQNQIAVQLKRYVNNPQISIFVSEYEARKVSVIGEVAKPGIYPLKRGRYTLVEILSESGGRNEKASSKILLSPANSNNSAIEIDTEELFGTTGKTPLTIPLLAGDTIIVPEAGRVDVDGEVNKPSTYPLAARTSVLGAIASAGGLTYSADINSVEIIRDIGKGKKAQIVLDLENIALKGGEDIRLRNGDVVRVPSASGRFATRQAVQILNGIFNFGVTRNVQ